MKCKQRHQINHFLIWATKESNPFFGEGSERSIKLRPCVTVNMEVGKKIMRQIKKDRQNERVIDLVSEKDQVKQRQRK